VTTDAPARGYESWRASGRFPPFLHREARHEAAHAVIAEVLGLSVVFVALSARPDAERTHPIVRHLVPGRDDPRGQVRVAIVALAGSAADGRDWRRVRDAEGCGDRASARKAAEAVTETRAEGEALLNHLWAVARRLTSRHRAAIDRLAAALLVEDTIPGQRVRAIVADGPGAARAGRR